MDQDFVDLLRALGTYDVRFLIVGAYALGVDKRPTWRARDLGDIESLDGGS